MGVDCVVSVLRNECPSRRSDYRAPDQEGADRTDHCARCNHRVYDHDTPDGSCWKCDCPRLVKPS